jgi:hypothetical protein
MSDQLQTLQDDISFLKALAVEGPTPAVTGGSILIAAGGVYGAASLVHWSMAEGLVPVPTPWAFPILWGGATVVFLTALTVIKRRIGEAKPVGAAGRASATAWAGVAWAIFTLWACMAIVAWRARSDVPLQLFPSIILALYGLAWAVVAAVSRLRWVWLPAVGAYVFAVLAALISDSPSVQLLFAGALVVLAIAPGVALIRYARAVA